MHSIYQWFGSLFGFEVCRSVKFMFWLMSGISLFIIVGIIVRTAEWIGKIRGRQGKRGRQLLTIMALLVLVASGCSRKTFIAGHLTDKQKIYLLEARCENLEKNVQAYREQLAATKDEVREVNLRRFVTQYQADKQEFRVDTLELKNLELKYYIDSIRRELDGIHMVLQRSIMNGVYGDVRLDSLIDALRNNPWLNMKIQQFTPLPGQVFPLDTSNVWRRLIEAGPLYMGSDPNLNFDNPPEKVNTITWATDTASEFIFTKGAWRKVPAQGSTKTVLHGRAGGGGVTKFGPVTLSGDITSTIGTTKKPLKKKPAAKKKKAITWESVMGSDWKKTKLDTLKKH